MNIFSSFPRYLLGFLPTPLIRLSRLEKFLGGPRLFMKRDDHTGLGLGGNKTRKLEFLIGDALSQGADCVITAGAAQSNHCRQTAAAAAYCGLECHLALGGSSPESMNGNLLLNRLFGAHIHWSAAMRKGENIAEIVAQLHKQGKKPYIIPYGGSNEIGALGFVAAIIELEQQLKDLDESVSHIVFASSSGGTHSGMLVGRSLTQKSYQLLGINIDKDEIGGISLDDHILLLAKKTAGKLNVGHSFTAEDVNLNSDYIGDGYGVVGEAERHAINITARNEGILLDPVYTGRAMGALIDMIKTGHISTDDTVLFWHTGGSPALFSYSNELL